MSLPAPRAPPRTNVVPTPRAGFAVTSLPLRACVLGVFRPAMIAHGLPRAARRGEALAAETLAPVGSSPRRAEHDRALTAVARFPGWTMQRSSRRAGRDART